MSFLCAGYTEYDDDDDINKNYTNTGKNTTVFFLNSMLSSVCDQLYEYEMRVN